MNKIALFLDVDGVLNQYRVSERLKRHKIYKKSGFDKKYDCFNPFRKKVLKLSKLIKKYNMDVYIFSAWTKEDLVQYLPFEIKGDTRKWISNVNKVSERYTNCLLIDDEISIILERGCKGEILNFNSNIKMYQPNWEFGLVKKDFKKIDKIMKGMMCIK